MTKSCSYSLLAGLAKAGLASTALILMTLMQTSVGADPAGSQQSNLVSRAPAIEQSKGPPSKCLPSRQPSIGIDGEFLPAYSIRSVAHSSKSGRKYVGYHSWCEGDPTSHSLRWESDAVNTMNDFIVCRYNLGGSSEAYLDFQGARVDFTNKDGSGRGDALALAVYEGTAPTILFKGNSITFGKPLFGPKKWPKVDKNNSLTIDRFSVPIRLRPGVKEVSVVLVGIDSWIDTKVTAQIYGLKMVSRPSNVQRPLKKK
jgi:hypothetical protein